ncbi:MAG: hypothetical protein R2725_03300 [Solirubrobacterales bacterium]
MRSRIVAVLAALAIVLVAAAPASAEFGFAELDVELTAEDGSAELLAGSHPFAFTTTLGVNTVTGPEGEVPDGEVKDLVIDQMEGLVGSQTAVPRCSSDAFNTRVEGRAACPDASAVGVVAVKGEFDVLPPETDEYLHVPVYNLKPSPGDAAKLGFVALNVPIVIDVGLREDPPYNLVAHLDDVPQALLFYGSRLTIWGNPASPAHDTLRGSCVGEPLELTAEPVSLGSCPVSVPEKPFLTLPRACQGPLPTVFTADSWADKGVFTEPQSAFTHDGGEPEGMRGCDSLNFDPAATVAPTTSQAESPTGLSVDLDVEDVGLESVTGRAKSDIKKAEVTLPEGVTVNPSAADGLGVCSGAQFEAASLTVVGCPESSKLGSVRVESPLIEETLEGSIYLAAQGDNPFGTLLAFYIMIRNEPNGIFIKQPGRIDPDPLTGQLVSTVDEIPQLPFSHFQLRFREGPRAPLTTPPLCGTYATKAVLTPWSGGEPVVSSSTFAVTAGPDGGPCPSGGVPPFTPGFEAGSENNAAGRYSPFSMRLTRRDGEQDLTRFSATLPKGLVPKIAGVPRCSDAAIAAAKSRSGRAELAAPSCPPGSRIGSVLGGAGVGSALTYVPGSVYLAGPYHGAPLSAAAIVPAVAGPFDVGTVVTRVALDLNPTTYLGEIDGAASDPIPHILEGIPLKLRDLRVSIDRPEFTLNPTSCAEMQVGATIFGSGADVFDTADDTTANATARYQAASCASLAFKPKLTLRFKGQTKRTGHPSVRAELLPRAGDANFKDAVTFLPKTTLIDAANVPGVCTRAQFAEDACPAESILGKARAFTPLLDEPLEGKVYFRSNGGARELPDLVADLKGQFRIVLVGFVDSRHGRIRTRFLNVPDAPVSKFVLRLFGGKNRGLIQNRANLCKHRGRGIFNLAGQNGRVKRTKPKIAVKCNEGKGRKSKRRDRTR